MKVKPILSMSRHFGLFLLCGLSGLVLVQSDNPRLHILGWFTCVASLFALIAGGFGVWADRQKKQSD
jgi:hypothetical protein